MKKKLLVQDLPILYSFVRCPYAMRARFALAYSNIQCILREVDLKNKPSELLKISAKGTVPVLHLPTGKIIDQSLDIIYHSININDPEGINAANKEEQDIIDQLIAKNDKEFIPLLNKYKYFPRFPEHSQLFYRQQIEEVFLLNINKILENSPYLSNNKMSIADIAIFPFIRQFANVDPEWFLTSNFKSLLKWLDSLTTHPIFKQIMIKYTPWKKEEEPVFFP